MNRPTSNADDQATVTGRPSGHPSGHPFRNALVVLLAIAALLVAIIVALNLRGESEVTERALTDRAADAPPSDAQIRRGAYLALAGNCAGCHTQRGAAPYAGGAGIVTPFGTVHASNLTPDPETGIGRWSASHFWRALHNGRSRDGRLLYPAFPYPNYTRITREDSDAIFAYLSSVTPVKRANTRHALRFPFDSQSVLAVWRALFFRPADAQDTREDGPTPRSEEWQRGAYLVNALGHCNACHSGRNLLGATTDSLDLGGGLIPMQNWYAPSLAAADEAGVTDWPIEEIIALLGTGVTPRASVLGPMADVVFRSTQYLKPEDLGAIAVYLKALPQAATGSSPHAAGGTPSPSIAKPATATQGEQLTVEGRKIYIAHCQDCHGERGEGVRGAYPALAGNRAVMLDPPANLVRIVLAGGFAPATAGNPRPYGMPPYATLLGDAEIAAVLSMIRNSWGNRGSEVRTADVQRYREVGR